MAPIASSQCCIVGAGPAGVFLSLLLARKGVHVTLLEMHADLDRDFRGDTVHASTMEVLDQIGLAEKVLALPHAKMRSIRLRTPGRDIELIQFKRLKTRFPFVAMMPQADFLNCLLEEARKYPNFHMKLSSPVSGLILEDGSVRGVVIRQEGLERDLRTDLVVGSDGRFSKLRRMAGLTASESSPPMDVAWIRLPREPGDPADTGGFYIAGGRICVLLSRETEWQMGYVFPKGDFSEIRHQGIHVLRKEIAGIVPMVRNRVHLIDDFSKVHLLNVKSDRLARWYRDGLLLIGDAAHVMSPVGGVGINYAIGDAVEAANVLVPAFRKNAPGVADLSQVQSLREPATRRIQLIQGFIQRNIVSLALKEKAFTLPLPARVLLSTPGLRDIPAKVVAFGFSRLRLKDEVI